MSDSNAHRYSASRSSHRQNPLPSMTISRSSNSANKALKARHDFLEYKAENRKHGQRPRQQLVTIDPRDERRQSQAAVERPSTGVGQSAPVASQATTGFDIDDEENSLPLKIFDGTKRAIADVSEQSRSYFWLRRIKEIFLHMGTSDERFSEFDMALARDDMFATCDVYLRNDLSKLKKKGGAPSDGSGADERGLIQKIEESVKQLRNAEALLGDATNSGNVLANLRTSTEQLMLNIRTLEQSVNNVAIELQNWTDESPASDAVRKALRTLPKEEKNQLKVRQEWDIKKLYAEVLKLSYTRNGLQTTAQKAELKPTKKGNEELNFGNAIWWYSCNEASIYHQINSVLKLENFELLMGYRYYVSDLCKMIEYMYKNEQSQTGKTNTYYRSASIDLDQLVQMKKSIDEKKKGQVISMGGFISTTTDLEIAKRYARTQSLSSGNARVLFKISVVPEKPCAAHAYIGHISFHPEEEEVLFSMGATFVVDKIDEPGPSIKDQPTNTSTEEEINYYIVHVTAGDVDKALLDDIRAKVQECSASQLSVLLARYLLELGEYRAARKYLNSLCSESERILKDDPALASVYNCLGMTFSRQNLHADAIEYYKQALDCQARLEYSNNNALAEIHNNIGLSFIGLKLMAEAQATFEEAERIQLREPSATRAHLASIYANIAYVHYAKKGAERNLEESETYFDKAIRLYQKTTSKITHDAIERALLKAECYTNYGHLLSVKKAPDAQERYDEALKIYTSILPDEDPKLLRARMNIMMELAHNLNFEKVIERYEDTKINELIDKQAANLFGLEKVVTQSDLIILIQIVGACYVHHQQEYFKAIRAWSRAYELERKAKLVQLLVPSEFSIMQWWRKLIDSAYHIAYEYFKSDQVQMPRNEEVRPQTARVSSARAKSAKPVQQAWPSINFSRGLICSKLYFYTDAIKYLERATQEPGNFRASLLLADIFEAMNDLDSVGRVYAFVLDQIKSLKDQSLLIEVSLARIKCYKDDAKAIEDLKQLETTLNSNDTDTTRISLKAIIYDTLVDYFLKLGKFSSVVTYADTKSITLKMRSLSHYHPSLASNYFQLAETCVRREQYRDALKCFELAVEIQRLNLASDNIDIKLVHYQMGDTYCMLNQLDEAREKYEFADNDIEEDADEDTSTDTENRHDRRRFLARASMRQHLARLYVQRADLDTAISEQSTCVEILKEFYPFDAPLQPIDTSTLVSRLQQLAFYTESLADAMVLEKSDSPESIYKKAISIQIKLYRYSDNNRGEILRKMGRYYEYQQNDKLTAIACYQEASNESPVVETAISIYYALGRLTEVWEEDAEAAAVFYNQAKELIPDDKPDLKAIVQQKCSPNQDSTPNERKDTTLDETIQDPNDNEDETDDAEITENVIPSIQQQSDDTVSKKAEAYRQLGDQEGLVQYCQNLIEQSTDYEVTLDFDVLSYDSDNLLECIYVKILSEILRACAEQIRPYEAANNENRTRRDLGDAHLQWAVVLQADDEFNKAMEHYFKSFILYKQCNEQNESNTKLIEFFEKLKTNDFENLTTLVSEYVSLSPMDGTRLWLKVAAGYRQCDTDDDDDSTDPIATAIEACSNALKTARELAPSLKAACHFAMLRIYQDLRYADDVGKAFVEQMASDGDYRRCQDHLTLFDQRLLCQWARDFISEYNERCDEDEQTEIPETLAKQFNLPSLAEAMNELNGSSQCLGDTLTLLDDRQGAIVYWEWIVRECESLYSKLVQRLIYDEDTTIGHVFNEIHHLQHNADKYILQLVACREQLARYNIQAGELSGTKASAAVDYFENAKKECETARKLRVQVAGFQKPQVNDLQQLINETTSKLEAVKIKAEQEEDDDDSDDSDDDSDENDADDTD